MPFVQFDLSSLVNAKKRRIKPPLATFYTLLSTWFYVGLIGIMPGTLGSVATFPVYYLILAKIVKSCTDYQCIHTYFLYVAIFMFLIGWWAIHKFQQVTNTYDHSFIVIDEVVGMLVSFALSYEYAIKVAKKLAPAAGLSPMVMAFILVLIIFRYFDIAKTFPINLIDQEFSNSFCVLIDDVLAAFYTAGVIYLLYLVIV